jgi:hypothetical protein
LITVEALVEKWQRAKTRVEETGKALSHLNIVSKFDMEFYLLFTFIASFNAYKYLGKGEVAIFFGDITSQLVLDDSFHHL